MKKIVPFSKDIVFNTDVSMINSISLEHTLKLNKNNNIEGEFIISGDYKDNNLINSEPFIYNLPFNIELDSKYKTDNIKIEIDDFNYDLINKNTLVININVLLNDIEELEELEVLEDNDNIETLREIEDVPSIINEISLDEDNYINYHIHIYRENDNIDSIIKKYKISKEELEEYNDLSNVTIGSKIIVPSND